MEIRELDRMLHDLRSPLARAKTLAKLLVETKEPYREDLLRLLQEALDELDQKLMGISAR
jgi:hypothetical protein